MKSFKICNLWLFIFFIVTSHWVATSATASPAAALGYEPKYPAEFEHFAYVNPQAPKGGELVFPAYGSFDSFNPFLLKGMYVAGSDLLFDSLMVKSLDEPFSLYGLLAEDIQLAEDKLSVTFRLNPQAKFSDGSEVTAADVKFSFDTLKSEQAHPRYRFYWKDIVAAEILDKRTVRFKFAQVNPELHLITAEIPIFSKAHIGDKGFDKVNREPLLGSGPYLVANHKLGKYITYKRNPDYWAKDLNTRRGTYNFDRITYKYYKDMDIALEALKSGEFDYMAVYNSKSWALDYQGPKFSSGAIKKETLSHHNNAGMQGFVFNLRKPIFQDIQVRRAINLAFDFEWANENLFYKQYERCNSYFTNSELAAAKGLPEGEELTLLKALQAQFPKEFPETVLTEIWQPVTTQPPHSLRDNLREAKKILTEAGWELKDGVLQNAQGIKLEFNVMLVQEGFERILAPFERNLNKLGIRIEYRLIDRALYQRRADTFDFDMVVETFPQSQSPGNELMNLWHSSAAAQEGSNNLIGLKSPVVDALIEKVIYAPNRQALVTAIHALDRVMLAGEYVVPNWYIGVYRVAYWDKFKRPEILPLYYQAEDLVIATWWLKSY